MREVRLSEGTVKLPGVAATRTIRRPRSLFQGDPEAPTAFNVILDREVVQPFLTCARNMFWGPEIQHEDLADLIAKANGEPFTKRTRCHTERLPFLVFADIFGSSQLLLSSFRS